MERFSKAYHLIPIPAAKKADFYNSITIPYKLGNEILSDLELEPAQIVLLTIAAVFAFNILCKILASLSELSFGRIKTKIFRALQVIPLVKAEINKELDKMTYDCTKKFSDKRKGKVILSLPEKAMPQK